MSRFSRRSRTACYLPDFQIFKGTSHHTMRAFGGPLMARHEAILIVRNDRQRTAAAARATYAIYSRSQNRILHIVQPQRPLCLPMAA